MKEKIENLNWFNLPHELKPILEELSENNDGGAGGDITADNITDATEIGKNILKGASANAIRTLIGAGTSNLTIGTTSTTAKAGDWLPPDVTTTTKGLMLGADKAKLNTIADEATKNDTDTNLKNRANHTGTQAISTITGIVPIAQLPTGTTATTVSLGNHTHTEASTTVAGFMSAEDKTKLNGISTSATANATDASLRDRATHTGTQAFTTLSGTATAAQIPSLDVAKITTGVFPVARVNTVLTGYVVGTAGAVSATDTLLQAIAKLEARIVALETP